jgi:protein O-GlcNAc transferase
MKKVVAGAIVLAGLAVAAILANQAVERDREYRNLIAQGDAALSRGQTFVAIEAFSGAIALKPDARAYLKRGEAHQRRGDSPETLLAALRDLRTAADIEPGQTRTLEGLGDVNFQLRRFDNAADSYEAYLRLDDRAPRVFYKLAVASRSGGRPTRAISALQQAVKLNPSLEEAHYVLGLCLKDREQLSEARAAFAQAVAMAPAFIPAREELADIHRWQGRTREEIDQLEALAALDPARAERLIALGLAYLRAGSRELAVTRLGRAAERFPDHPGIYTALGRVWLDAAEDRGEPTDVRKALEALGPVASQSSAGSEVLGLYGQALVLAGRHAEAEAALRQATERFPVEPDVFLHYAAVAQRLGHLADARRALMRHAALVDDDRDEAEHAARVADLSMQLSDAPTAVAWYQKAESFGTADSSLLRRMAAAQWSVGRRDVAKATLARAMENDPDNPAGQALALRFQAR